MFGNFIYSNPTKLIFGENSLNYLKDELKKYGPKVMLIYGGGSIKRNGIYDKVISILKEASKEVFEDAGVMPNPTKEKLFEGFEQLNGHNSLKKLNSEFKAAIST